MTLEDCVEACVDGSTGSVETGVEVLGDADANVEFKVDVEVAVVVSVEVGVEVDVKVEVTLPVLVGNTSTIVDVNVESLMTVLKEPYREVTVPPGTRLMPPGPSQSSPSKQHLGCPFVPNPAQYVPGWHPTSKSGQHVYELGMQ